MLDRKLFDSLVPLADLEALLADRAASFHDAVLPATALAMDPRSGNLVTRNGTTREHPLQDHALNLMAGRLRIPAEYLRRCPPDLQAENVNHWLRRLGEKRLLVRFNGEEIRAILTTAYTPVDNLTLIRGLRETAEAHDIAPVVRFEWTATRFVCQVVAERQEHKVAGESYFSGLHLVNSEVGAAAVSLDALVYRLVCTNGMVVREILGLRRIHRVRPDRLTAELQEAMAGMHRVFTVLADHLRRAMDEVLDIAPERLTALFTDAGISVPVQEAITEHLATEGGRTRAALVNAVTATANRAEFSLAERETLQRFGGRLLVGRGA